MYPPLIEDQPGDDVEIYDVVLAARLLEVAVQRSPRRQRSGDGWGADPGSLRLGGPRGAVPRAGSCSQPPSSRNIGDDRPCPVGEGASTRRRPTRSRPPRVTETPSDASTVTASLPGPQTEETESSALDWTRKWVGYSLRVGPLVGRIGWREWKAPKSGNAPAPSTTTGPFTRLSGNVYNYGGVCHHWGQRGNSFRSYGALWGWGGATCGGVTTTGNVQAQYGLTATVLERRKWTSFTWCTKKFLFNMFYWTEAEIDRKWKVGETWGGIVGVPPVSTWILCPINLEIAAASCRISCCSLYLFLIRARTCVHVFLISNNENIIKKTRASNHCHSFRSDFDNAFQHCDSWLKCESSWYI